MTIKVYMGWDPKDGLAYDVAVDSLKKHASVPVNVIPVREADLRKQNIYWRKFWIDPEDGQKYDELDRRPFSTEFSFTRFAVPKMAEYSDEWVLFCDPDMMFRADIKELFDDIDDSKSVMCVKHVHIPEEETKMWGVKQTKYFRKNWSSFMLLNPSRCRTLTPYALNNWEGSRLHAMVWARDEDIGAIPESWNWLDGWSDPEICPKVVHFTRGTPDMGVDSIYAEEWSEYAKIAQVRASA